MAEHPAPWRVGRKVHRTIYDSSRGEDGVLIGVMDTPELAARVVAAVNELEGLRAEVRRLLGLYDDDGHLDLVVNPDTDEEAVIAAATHFPLIAALLREEGR